MVISNTLESLEIPVEHVFTVSPNILALRIDSTEVIRGKQGLYQPEDGDQIKGGRDKVLWRNGEKIGMITGSEQKMLRPFDRLEGQALNTDWADVRENYLISSPEGDAIPLEVYRKSKPMDMANIGSWAFDWDVEHTIFLELSNPLTEGETYTLDFQGEELRDLEFTYNPEQIRSEAIHVSHLGFDPDDLGKVAFLSTWMGNGGALDYPDELNFWLIDEATGVKVYSGTTELSKSKEDIEDKKGRNYNGTNVYAMDFSDFQTPGEYRVYVDGIGTSFPFEIVEDTWDTAFYVSARGMYHQRSGIALEQPYTDWERPRDLHPNDGVKIYASNVTLMEGNQGLGVTGENIRNLELLAQDEKGELIEVTEAWGGWHDAGDFDRRIQHVEAVRLFLELGEMFPDYFETFDLNIPESKNAIPDLIDEALWGLDVFKRLQTEEGGIRGGIENPFDPWSGSWQLDVAWAYAPDFWSSFIYTGGAAKAAYILKDYDPDLAAQYQESAVRAMIWAEQEYADYDLSLLSDGQARRIKTERNLAAAELYRLTGDNQWHDIFLETTDFINPNPNQYLYQNQEEAAFVYYQTQQPDIREDIQTNAFKALIKGADWNTEIVHDQYGFKFNKNPWAPAGYGNLGAPQTSVLARAHALTGNEDYLEAMVLATQFMAGANPDNMSYTTGLGHRTPQDPLLVDRKALGTEELPPGITIYGPNDLRTYGWHWSMNYFKDVTFPNIFDWPTVENVFNVYYNIPVSEFTVQQTIAPTAYTWGYLAAIDSEGTPVNEPPTDISLDGSTVEENDDGAVIGILTVTDPDSNNFNFSLSDDRFEVVNSQLKLKAGESLDFETEASVNLEITVTDDGFPTQSLTKSFTINVIESVTDSENILRIKVNTDDYLTFNNNSFDRVIAEAAGIVIKVNGYDNGVDKFVGHSSGDTKIEDHQKSRTLNFSETELNQIAMVDASDGQDTVIASNLSAMTIKGGPGNDNLNAGTQEVTFVYDSSDNGYDKLFNGTGTSVALAEQAGTVIKVNGYDNGVDKFVGHSSGDTKIEDSQNSRTLDFSQTIFDNIAIVNASGGNDIVSIAQEHNTLTHYIGGSGTDTLKYDEKIYDVDVQTERGFFEGINTIAFTFSQFESVMAI